MIVFQLLSRVWLCDPMGCNTLGFPVLHYLLEFAQMHVHWVGDAIQPPHPLSPLLPPSIFPAWGFFSVSWLFASGGLSIRASASASVLPVNIQGWFRIDWFDLAIQGTLQTLIQYHSSKPSILWHSAFFMVQLSHLYMTTGKTVSWLYGPLSTKWCLCFLVHCLGLP